MAESNYIIEGEKNLRMYKGKRIGREEYEFALIEETEREAASLLNLL